MKKTASLKFAGLAVLGSFALAACNQANLTGSAKTYAFAAQPQVGYTAQAGTATRADLSSKDTTTVLSATGLKPATAYVAHYHIQGDATKAPCASNGAVVDGMIGGMMFTSDANGNLTIKGLNTTSALANAKYINIHEAAALTIVPLCADLTLAPTK